MSNMTSAKMNTRNMSDTEILGLFEESFNGQISGPNNLDDVEFEIERLVGSSGIRIFANLYGMAGSPTVDTYSDTNNIRRIEISRADKGVLKFHYVPHETRALGGNEYQVVYDSE